MSEPLLLAVETATRTASAALLRGERLLAEVSGASAENHSAELLVLIDAVLRRAGVFLAAVDVFALAIGPGSFTGLRVGLATVKGLAFGTGKLVVPVSTLAALTQVVEAPSSAVAVALDARRGDVYAAVYALDGTESVPEAIYAPRELLACAPRPLLLIGDGVAVIEQSLTTLEQEATIQMDRRAHSRFTARHVGMLGAQLLDQGAGVDAAALVPRYLRRAAAELVS